MQAAVRSQASHELCLFQIMRPARSNTIVWKKTMWSMAIILYFISRRTQWLESPYFVDEPPDQEHDTRSIRFVGMSSSFKHLRQDLSVSKEQASAKVAPRNKICRFILEEVKTLVTRIGCSVYSSTPRCIGKDTVLYSFARAELESFAIGVRRDYWRVQMMNCCRDP